MPNWCYNYITIKFNGDSDFEVKTQAQNQEKWDTWMKIRKFCERSKDEDSDSDSESECDEEITYPDGLFQSTVPLTGKYDYDEANSKWGTKWDVQPKDAHVSAYMISGGIYGYVEFSCRTAWGIPEKWADALVDMGLDVTIHGDEESDVEIIYHKQSYYQFDRHHICEVTSQTFVEYCHEHHILVDDEPDPSDFIRCFHTEDLKAVEEDFGETIRETIADNLYNHYENQIENDWEEYYEDYDPEEYLECEEELQKKMDHLEALERCVKRGLINEAEYILECNELKV